MAGTPTTLAPVFDGLPFSGGDHNNNLYLIEQSLMGVAPYIVSGLGLAPGVGLSVVVSAGEAVIGTMQSYGTFTIGSLADGVTNYLYLRQDGTASASTDPTTPTAAIRLGTAVTVAGTCTSVSTLQSSARMQFVPPNAMILGGPGAGNPPSQNLASWAAAAGDGISFYGSLPNQAVGNGRQPLTTVTTTYPIAAADYYVLGNTTAAGFTVTLPTAVGVSGKEYVIKSTGTANNLTVQTTLAQTIDGSAPPVVLTTLQHIKVVADGSGWWLV